MPGRWLRMAGLLRRKPLLSNQRHKAAPLHDLDNDISIFIARNQLQDLLLGVADWNNQMSAGSQLLYKRWRNCWSRSGDDDRIIRRSFRIS